MFLSLFIFILSFFSVIFFSVHYIYVLLLLEALLLSVFLYLGFDFFNFNGLVGMFTFLLVMVCMGGFSVSLLVSLSRFFGRDFWYFRFVL